MNSRYLEGFAVGQTFGSGTLRIDIERIKTFAAEFDPQPFHLDEEAAHKTFFRDWLRAAGTRQHSPCGFWWRGNSNPPAA
jgi:acyl dehydratase